MNEELKQQVIKDWIASVEAQKKQEEKYNKLLEFVKDKSLPQMSDDRLYAFTMSEIDNCDFSLAQECRDLLQEIGEIKSE